MSDCFWRNHILQYEDESCTWPTGAAEAAGYTFGGYNYNGAVGVYLDDIDVFNFASETAGLLGVTLDSDQYYGNASTAIVQDRGYNYGGYDNPGGETDRIERLDYEAGTLTTIAGTLQEARYQACACVNSSIYGFHIGGSIGGSPFTTNHVDKNTYASETIAVSANFTLTIKIAWGVSAPDAHGYGYTFGGHKDTGSLNETSDVCSLNYSTEASAVIADNLSQATKANAAANSETHAWGAGGSDSGTYRNQFQKMTFATEVIDQPLFMFLPTTRDYLGAYNSDAYCFFIGGSRQGTFISQSTIDTVDFVTDTVATLVATLSQGVDAFGATQSGGTL